MANELADPRHVRLCEWLLAKQIGEHNPATYVELGDELGVSDRTLRDWRDKPEFQARLRELTIQVVGDPERIRQLMDSMFAQALDPESSKQVQAASVWAKMAGVLTPKPKVAESSRSELLDLSSQELDKLALELLAAQPHKAAADEREGHTATSPSTAPSEGAVSSE